MISNKNETTAQCFYGFLILSRSTISCGDLFHENLPPNTITRQTRFYSNPFARSYAIALTLMLQCLKFHEAYRSDHSSSAHNGWLRHVTLPVSLYEGGRNINGTIVHRLFDFLINWQLNNSSADCKWLPRLRHLCIVIYLPTEHLFMVKQAKIQELPWR